MMHVVRYIRVYLVVLFAQKWHLPDGENPLSRMQERKNAVLLTIISFFQTAVTSDWHFVRGKNHHTMRILHLVFIPARNIGCYIQGIPHIYTSLYQLRRIQHSTKTMNYMITLLAASGVHDKNSFLVWKQKNYKKVMLQGVNSDAIGIPFFSMNTQETFASVVKYRMTV